MTKKNANAQLIYLILLLQEFNFEIRDKKYVENIISDHLSCIPNSPCNELPINDNFPDEQLLVAFREPSFADIVNYLVTNQTPSHLSKQDIYRFLSPVRYFFWEESYLFKYCSDQIIRRCILDEEIKSVMSFCHELACGGHLGPHKTAEKCCRVSSIGPLYSKMLMNFARRALDTRW